MKRWIMAITAVLGLLLAGGCSIVDTRPPCVQVVVDKTRAFSGADAEHDNQPVTLRNVSITFTKEFGRPYALGRDGNSPIPFPRAKDNPLTIMMMEGNYTFYFSGKNSENCNRRVLI